MIKRIPISALRPGMFLHDLNCGWRVEPIFLSRFRIENDKQLEKILSFGAREAYIDTTLGDDQADAPTEDEVKLALEAELRGMSGKAELPHQYRLSSRKELDEAVDIHNTASQLIGDMMADVRLGQQVGFDAVTEAMSQISDSVLGHAGTLVQLGQIRNKDNYTFQHCVSVCALLAAFARTLELNREIIRQIEVGALLHDIGKMRVPLEILNKPGRLSDMEFDEIKQHVAYGREAVADSPWMTPTALAVLGEHHERFDGTGYPGRLKGEDITQFGQMAAIVDVYDAITADRVYHKAMAPVEALRKLQEWSRFHFNEELVRHFIRSIGIYPLRTLVRLESGLLGIVVEQNAADLLRPRLRIVFDALHRVAMAPKVLDLAKSPHDRIVTYESPETWGIDIDRHLVEVA